MSQEHMENRLSKVETAYAVLQRDVTTLSAHVDEIGAGVKQLLQRDAARPEPINASKIAATVVTTCAVVGALWGFVTWLVEHSPTVQAHEKRLTRLDDKEDGRLPRVEQRLQNLEAWRPSVVRH